MNHVFTNMILKTREFTSMQSGTGAFRAELEVHDASESQPRSFELYEAYSLKTMAQTIRERKEVYERRNRQATEELEAEVDIEVENFHIWLEVKKKLDPFEAHYYAVSLKSLLNGLPIGVQVAQLFDVLMEKNSISTR